MNPAWLSGDLWFLRTALEVYHRCFVSIRYAGERWGLGYRSDLWLVVRMCCVLCAARHEEKLGAHHQKSQEIIIRTM